MGWPNAAQFQQNVPQRRELLQEQYTSPSHTTSPIALYDHPIVFSVNGNRGIRVTDALEERFTGLENCDYPLALPEPIGVKITYRIQVRPAHASLSVSVFTLTVAALGLSQV